MIQKTCHNYFNVEKGTIQHHYNSYSSECKICLNMLNISIFYFYNDCVHFLLRSSQNCYFIIIINISVQFSIKIHRSHLAQHDYKYKISFTNQRTVFHIFRLDRCIFHTLLPHSYISLKEDPIVWPLSI